MKQGVRDRTATIGSSYSSGLQLITQDNNLLVAAEEFVLAANANRAKMTLNIVSLVTVDVNYS